MDEGDLLPARQVAEKEEHDKESHTKVPCQYCSSQLSKKDVEKHESICEMRPKPCKYCEQILKFAEYDKHVTYCGSKTKKCDVCGKNVCLKDQDMHQFGGECQAYI